MRISSLPTGARASRPVARAAGLSLALGALSVLASCANFYPQSPFESESTRDIADPSSEASGGGVFQDNATTSPSPLPPPSGAGDDLEPPPFSSGMYASLCGDTTECMPGTLDCTPGGNPNMSSGSGGSVIACQIISTDEGVTSTCGSVGTFKAGDPCTSAAHCGEKLGCVRHMGGGVCRPYCCDSGELCPTDSYCAPLPMAEAEREIPVCTPVHKCKLLDDSVCTDGQACSIVRKDGTTSCVTPGSGKRGEACPCAAGHVCAPATNTCVKLCHIGNDAVDCGGGGACQGGVMLYQDGIGVCVYSDN